MRLRYRVLKSRFDGAAFLAEWRAQRRQDTKDYKENVASIYLLNGPFGLLFLLPLAAGLRLLGVFEALIPGARNVEATELEGTESELRQQLLTGRLKVTDLVLVEGSWQAFSDSALFADDCFEAESRNRWLNRLSWFLSMRSGSHSSRASSGWCSPSRVGLSARSAWTRARVEGEGWNRGVEEGC